eukprot:UN24550
MRMMLSVSSVHMRSIYDLSLLASVDLPAPQHPLIPRTIGVSHLDCDLTRHSTDRASSLITWSSGCLCFPFVFTQKERNVIVIDATTKSTEIEIAPSMFNESIISEIAKLVRSVEANYKLPKKLL